MAVSTPLPDVGCNRSSSASRTIWFQASTKINIDFKEFNLDYSVLEPCRY